MNFGTNVIWRYAPKRRRYSICDGINLDEGFVMVNRPEKHLSVLKNSYYKPFCYNEGPVLSSFKRFGVNALPQMEQQWNQYRESTYGDFKYSIYPIIYSLTVSTVMAIFLTIIVFTNHTQKPSWLLRVGSLLASINLVILIVRAIIFLSRQHALGVSDGAKLLDDLQSDEVFNIIDFIFVLIAQFAQVQIIIRLFSRVKEKRVSFILGGLLSICAQVIWGVSTFSNFDQTEDSDISILPAFTYLLRIALATMYSGLIIIYMLGKRNFIFQKSIILLTILTFLVINLQIAFFITDISNIWVSELSEIFNTTIYVSVTVIPWEWINRVHALERHQQREGVLGRPVYEDEYRDIAKYEILDENVQNNLINDTNDNDNNDNNNNDNDGNDDGNQNDTNGNGNSNRNTPRGHDEQGNKTKFTSKIKDTFSNTTNTLMYFTDQVIAYGLAVPRSVSVSSTARENEQRQKRANNANRKEVYIYSKKEVVIDSEDESPVTSSSSNHQGSEHLLRGNNAV
ncbi:pH-response regulator protein [Wickerhamomyces ciferrii]|uniref:pH-response regulator protein palH/RIM21 n=1 Tax=Wickerhamomyces ciferrii (strain ATCC 14091 / BCRC 22168 / CBS 111 / JCM 3599 / NBRC 0793 / NRRL Y-1031 F-60-10) TaxID=1206466 RepID=K0KUT5_WICCF|nr:pH-response regulator protein [Wickerhamomyces ciferrii]CCH44933.1 pH-response regulator protein [Wickerhamomyces ciferrii]